MVAAVLVFVIILSSSTPALADSLASLQSQYSTLQQTQKQLQQTLSSQNSQLASASQKQNTLNASVNVTIQQINILNSQISTLNAQLASKAQDIAATQQSEQENYTLYKQRLRAMYESGDSSFIDVLLSSKDLTDFLSRAETLSSISVYDNNLINSLKQDEANLKADQASMQTTQASLLSSKSTLSAQQESLSEQLAQQGQYVSQLAQNVNATKQQQKQIDAEINSVIAAEAAEKAREMGSQHSSASASSVISFAERLQGKPYVFDTAGPNKFDCSGFTQYVFANAAGIALTHSALQQSQVGTAVSRSSLQPGDLVFFATEGGRTVSHVGIYVGNNNFIAANTSTGVAIVSLSTAYWNNDYVSARRLLN
jgi:cell wall-associated NlpC family hydrolase